MLCFCVKYKNIPLHKKIYTHTHLVDELLKDAPFSKLLQPQPGFQPLIVPFPMKGKITLNWMIREKVAFGVWLIRISIRRDGRGGRNTR